MKKILLLGGSRYILPVIKKSHELGIYTITCDYIPDNIAHRFSDEYQNVSIIEKDQVLALAEKLHVDGIMSFACDPGVETAAYVAEKLGLPSVGTYEAVTILQNKAKFRQFLMDHNFNVPKAKGYVNPSDAMQDVDYFRWPVIVKPVDSAGSKGVTRVDEVDKLVMAAEHAITFSKTKQFIVEEYIEKQGFSSDTDCFSIDGKLVYASFNNQMFDINATNPYTPSAYSWPSEMPKKIQAELRMEIQRLISLLQLRTSIYNVETRQGTDGKPYIMEISPRGGGNRLAEILSMSTGTDLIANTVKAAVGMPVVGINGDPVYSGFWAEIILHADKDGKFKDLWIAPELIDMVVEQDLWVTQGEEVHSFSGANNAIGTLILKFRNKEQLTEYMYEITKHIRIITE